MNKKILVVEDEPSIVTLLTYNLEKAGYIAESVHDGEEAVKKVSENDYDLMILDIMLPKMDGMEVVSHLRRNQHDIPVLMLTARDTEIDKILGLELGADDYLTKPFSPRELIARIKAILRRTNKQQKNDYKQLQIGKLTIYPEKYEATIHGERLIFTLKEFELLLYLANHKGKVLSRGQLLNGVWNYDFEGDTRIVDVHISRLREKIEENTKKPQYILTVHGLGYKMEEPT